jgi:hypothetical protein
VSTIESALAWTRLVAWLDGGALRHVDTVQELTDILVADLDGTVDESSGLRHGLNVVTLKNNDRYETQRK